MKKHRPYFISFRLLATIFSGLFLLVLGGFYFFKTSAQIETTEKPVEQHLVNGRLAFSSHVVGPTFPDGRIITSNSDGSGGSSLPIATSLSPTQPARSPDGTKIAYQNNGINTMEANGANQVRIVANIILFPQCCDTVYEYPTWQPVAQTPNTFSINGRVSYNNVSMSGVTVNLSGTTNAATTTDAAGNYQFSGLTAGGNYIVSPSVLKHYFTPPNLTFNNLTANQIGNFEVKAVCQGGNCVKNGKIAYYYNEEIYTINPDGTNDTNLTNSAGVDTEPNYSAGGTELVFSTNRDGNYEIYKMDEDGINLVRLTNNSAADSYPFYSPDGASIVFFSNRDGNNEIYKMNADGSNQIRLTNEQSTDIYPSFSPDGSKIIFISY